MRQNCRAHPRCPRSSLFTVATDPVLSVPVAGTQQAVNRENHPPYHHLTLPGWEQVRRPFHGFAQYLPDHPLTSRMRLFAPSLNLFVTLLRANVPPDFSGAEK